MRSPWEGLRVEVTRGLCPSSCAWPEQSWCFWTDGAWDRGGGQVRCFLSGGSVQAALVLLKFEVKATGGASPQTWEMV